MNLTKAPITVATLSSSESRLLLASMMVPGIVYFVPTYVMIICWSVTGDNQKIWPIALGFQRMMIGRASCKGLRAEMLTNHPIAFTLATVATLLTILIFLFLQRYFVEGVQGFALKG